MRKPVAVKSLGKQGGSKDDRMKLLGGQTRSQRPCEDSRGSLNFSVSI